MQHPRRTTLALLAACAMLAGCGVLDRFKEDAEEGSPTSPSAPTVSLDLFAGRWSSAAPSTPATGCGSVTYTVTPVSATSANVMFQATCASSIAVTGSGTGKINGSSLDWTAQGLVSQGGVNCPVAFTNGKAAEEATGAIKVVYAGTVCGIPVSGTETVRR